MARPAEGSSENDLSSLRGAKVVLGVSGGIAAYKAVEVCRRLVDAGAHVTPVLTKSTLEFVGAATFSALASSPAVTSLFGGPDPIPHTTLGQSADLIVVAPATARVIGSYAAGISSDALTATLLATRAPVLLCPAMHTEMWEHPAVQANLTVLRSRGTHVLEPAAGRLAGGDVGSGRMQEPAAIVEEAARILSQATPGSRRDLEGIRLLVTAGGTREPIDPVRFIGNRSSGKQGYAIAEAAAARGADVTLVSSAELKDPAGVAVIRVETAEEMADAVFERAPASDVVVMAAAVADFRPKAVADSKLRKSEGVPEIVLEPTVDILAELGRRRRSAASTGTSTGTSTATSTGTSDGAPSGTTPRLLVGFAAETEYLHDHAAEKLTQKGVDLIVGNDVSAAGVGFEHDTNAVTIFGMDGETEILLSSKREIANAVLDSVSSLLRRPGEAASQKENK